MKHSSLNLFSKIVCNFVIATPLMSFSAPDLQRLSKNQSPFGNRVTRPVDLNTTAQSKSGFFGSTSESKEISSQQKSLNFNGGQGSGGGTFVTINGRKQLLDLYVNNGFMGSGRYTLPRTQALASTGIEKIFQPSSDLLKETDARIRRWNSSSPFLTSLIRQALSSAPFYYVNRKINVRDENFDLENKTPSSPPVTGAIAVQNFGIILSMIDFEEADSESQIGVLVHESVRYVNLVYGLKMSPRSLQRLTALIVQGNPQTQSLNSVEILGEDLLKVVGNSARDDIRQTIYEFCNSINESSRFVPPDSSELAAVRQGCLAIQNMPEDAISADEFADEFTKKMSQYASDAVEPWDNLEAQRNNGEPTEFIERVEFRREARRQARAIRNKCIFIRISLLAATSRNWIQFTSSINDQAVKLNLLNVILDSGIDSANKGKRSEEVDRAKALVDKLVQIQILK